MDGAVQPGRVTATVCVKRLPGPKSFPAAHGRASPPPQHPPTALQRLLALYFFFCSHLIPQTQLKLKTLT